MLQLGNQILEAKDEVKLRDEDVLQYQQQLEQTMKRCTRAEKIAAFIESQYKV
jgi:hypothetical protein